MALITGLPNFFGTAKPVQSDFNNAAKAIIQQIGGEYYDEGLTAYTIANGNIDNTNLVSQPGFRNNQKSEARSFNYDTTIAAVSAGAFVSFPTFGPFMADCTIIGIGLIAIDGSYYLSEGTNPQAYPRFSLYLNNAPLTSISVVSKGGATISGTAGDPTYVSVSIPIRMGDSLMLDPLDGIDNPASPLLFSTATRVQGTPPATVPIPSDLNVSLFMVGPHVR